MKILLIIISMVVLLTGCTSGSEIQKALKDLEYEKCKDVVENLDGDSYYNGNQIIAITIIVSNCEAKEEILAELRKAK